MLPSQLLRAKIKNKGKNIDPVFCGYANNNNNDDCHHDNHHEIHLAAKLIEEFEDSWKNNERNGVLSERIATLEEQYGDYKLVRGLYTLLQRRCIFGSKRMAIAQTRGGMANSIANSMIEQSESSLGNQSLDPSSIRRELFEESSKRGFALTDFEKTQIIDRVASKLGISSTVLIEHMWSDLDENLIIEHFFKITPKELIGWYNLSLIQTLLFNCTQLEFSVKGGSNWKHVLRDLKRLGLMYYLEKRQHLSRDQKETYAQDQAQEVSNGSPAAIDDASIICSVNGPLSIFKLTDRYGTAIAKLLPSIISCDTWSLKAWIVRKNLTLGKKIYEFEISHDRCPLLLRERARSMIENNGPSKELVTSGGYYDSKVEEDFAKRFVQSANGWNLIREPDPIILSNGKALIPDFMFEKYGKKVYLEIVGFWTTEYMQNKLSKIYDISITNMASKLDLLVAVNSDHYAASSNSIGGSGSGSKSKLAISQLSKFIEKNHLIIYKNDNLPLGPVLQYLNSIEKRIQQELVSQHSSTLLIELDHIAEETDATNGIISIQDLAKKYNIPLETAIRIIKSQDKPTGKKNQKGSHDNEDCARKFIVVGKYLVLTSRINELRSLLEETTAYSQASLLFTENGIPEEIHIDLLSKLGFNILWKGIDYNTARIEKERS